MRTEDKFFKLASLKGADAASDSVQNAVKDIIAYARHIVHLKRIPAEDMEQLLADP